MRRVKKLLACLIIYFAGMTEMALTLAGLSPWWVTPIVVGICIALAVFATKDTDND